MKPYQNQNSSKKKQVEKMFDSISFEYDKLNRLISAGNDVKWRKTIYKIAERLNPIDILDIATGTADIALELSKIKGSKITGLDISEKMLDVGRQKVTERNLENKVSLVSGDAENLNFSKSTFDLISIGFGVRNFQNLEKGLLESFRVLREGGTLIILETSVPQNRLVKLFYLLFSRTFIPLVGSLFSKDKKAYKYLQKSAEEFPSGENFSQILKSCGFKNVQIMPLMLGASSIYVAKKN
ncbi:bifunctional demethylmenaquinone methyltransferase/2-methoxy-6-polyprenyl-1,4-benzoquinol methylase UbiE [Flavobacteriaceae bacterium]|nr:bifunctional demethylmenaquinone methyltransferase/2-methoxy-6-polyprenyl-1,4-benzoquinol methylase UbiE [Flavobacteriaceae bacterium]MDC1459102.1 bifunctional demethylmenaquinone methyltransferase/2-methoxy-6-polyprenyl-1,4-benzoquinol methylase UbiE [Flavobacteriaceae bacterium]